MKSLQWNVYNDDNNKNQDLETTRSTSSSKNFHNVKDAKEKELLWNKKWKLQVWHLDIKNTYNFEANIH